MRCIFFVHFFEHGNETKRNFTLINFVICKRRGLSNSNSVILLSNAEGNCESLIKSRSTWMTSREMSCYNLCFRLASYYFTFIKKAYAHIIYYSRFFLFTLWPMNWCCLCVCTFSIFSWYILSKYLICFFTCVLSDIARWFTPFSCFFFWKYQLSRIQFGNEWRTIMGTATASCSICEFSSVQRQFSP